MTVQTLVLEQKRSGQEVRRRTPLLGSPVKRVYDSLPYEDDEVLESNWHRDGMNQLIETIRVSWVDSPRAFVGGDMFVYFDPHQVKRYNFRGPDVFVVKNVDPDPTRKSWVVWDEGNRVPDVVIELSSPSTKEVDFGQKKVQYEQILKVKDYFIYDPDKLELVGWRLQGGVYVRLMPNQRNWLWSEELGLWVGVHYGAYQGNKAYYPRFFDKQGQLLLNDGELKVRERERADRERERADRERERADREQREKERERLEKERERERADRERLEKERERERAESERREKERERFEKERERERADQAELRADQERLEKERLMAKLRELGLDPTLSLEDEVSEL